MSMLGGMLGSVAGMAGGGGGSSGGAIKAESGNTTSNDFGSDSYAMPTPMPVGGNANQMLLIGGAVLAVLAIVLLMKKL